MTMQGDTLFDSYSLDVSEREVRGGPFALDIKADALRMVRLFWQALVQLAPRGMTSSYLRRPNLRFERIAVQVRCPEGLCARVAGEQVCFSAEDVCASRVEVQLGVGEGGAKMAILGDTRIRLSDATLTKEAAVVGFLAVQDLDANITALSCASFQLAVLSEEQKAWKPGARVRMRNMKNKAFEGRQGSLVEWRSDVSRWYVKLDGQDNLLSVSQTRLRLYAKPWRVDLSLDSVEANVTDSFIVSIDQHIMSLQDVLCEMVLHSATLQSRPLGLRIQGGDVLSVAGLSRASGLLPGSHVVAVGSKREGRVDLATCNLPVVLLSKPPPALVEATWRIRAFEFKARRK